ncbi:Protein TAPETUM DETERMINANT 1 [Camellia lanceoleosa]|uniref:Protein TAPETUM DETERMINANT 1 n=1 Tax=Camellia lanceoleosa TaxID=1840588 RepID=A0ACC0HFA1_9ERIC|nr:Protein TAPETUM DETERMINANT 1 [Camellia lanceoleosa]
MASVIGVHVAFFFLMTAIIMPCNSGLHLGSSNKKLHSPQGDNNITTTSTLLSHRKLLQSGKCTNRDISITQGQGSSTGIPEYIVEITNTCLSNCPPSNIHLHCGLFASARLVDPQLFKRLSNDDCLVNGGKPLKASQVIRFSYSNTFKYPISFKSAKFC